MSNQVENDPGSHEMVQIASQNFKVISVCQDQWDASSCKRLLLIITEYLIRLISK